MVVSIHPFRIEFDGAGEIGARLRELAQGKLAMAALGQQRGVIGRDGEAARACLHRFAILPHGRVGLRQFEKQIGVFRICGKRLLRSRNDTLVVGNRIELRAQRRRDLQHDLGAGLAVSRQRDVQRERGQNRKLHDCQKLYRYRQLAAADNALDSSVSQLMTRILDIVCYTRHRLCLQSPAIPPRRRMVYALY